MESQELISSGLLELYCIGQTNMEENRLVESMADKHSNIKEEINQINEALLNFADTFSIAPPPDIKSKILKRIQNEIELPPLLHQQTDVRFWNKYLKENGIEEPKEYEDLWMFNLPSDDSRVTYVVYGKHGGVEDPPHVDQDEYLLVLKGSCTINQNGKTEHYRSGDLIYIPKNTPHLAEVTSSETLIVVGQRIAA
jgi:quercetin dioxygenase-like cupin family protein